MMTKYTANDILDFWYSDEIRQSWFSSTPELDALIRDKFEALWLSAKNGELEAWMKTAEGCLALAIILDQFPLNMFRGEAKSFSTEQQAVSVSYHAIEKGFDQELIKQRGVEQIAFLYMPLMHSENMQDQQNSVKYFEKAGLEHNLRFAKHHLGIVEKFGRFPHRNAILGRENTPEEITYLLSKEAFTG